MSMKIINILNLAKNTYNYYEQKKIFASKIYMKK